MESCLVKYGLPSESDKKCWIWGLAKRMLIKIYIKPSCKVIWTSQITDSKSTADKERFQMRWFLQKTANLITYITCEITAVYDQVNTSVKMNCSLFPDILYRVSFIFDGSCFIFWAQVSVACVIILLGLARREVLLCGYFPDSLQNVFDITT